MVSPMGAFIPTEGGATTEASRNSLALRFGRWRYNADDAAHETYGLTYARAVGSRSRASVTAAYVYVACVDCGGWGAWGVDFESRLLQVEGRQSLRRAATNVGVRISAGGAGLRGPPHSIARTAALELPVGVRVHYRASHDVRVSLSPGVGYGNMWGPSGSDGGVLSMLGITVGSDLTSSLGMELGAHRVFIAGGPLDLGVSFAWAFR